MPDAGRPVRWGILGTALITRKLLAGARLARRVEVAAVASRDRARAEAHAAEHGIPVAHGSYEALLADPGIDAVYVPVPNALHHPWTLEALRAGKHVLCEKPYSRHPEEVTAAFDLAAERGLVLSEAYMWRYHPQTVQLAALVAQGAIGELRLVSASFTWPCDAPGDVRLDPALDGGSLLDVGCYCVSAARLLAGEPVAVAAHQERTPSGVDARMTGSLRFAEGALAHFDCGLLLPDRSSLEVMGTAGTLRVADPWHCRRTGIALEHPDGRTEHLQPTAGDAYALELEAMGAAIRGEAGPLLGREDALGQARALAALRAAAERTEPEAHD